MTQIKHVTSTRKTSTMPPSTHDHSNYRPSRIDKKFYRSCKYGGGGGSGGGGGGENSDDKHALFTRSVDSVNPEVSTAYPRSDRKSRRTESKQPMSSPIIPDSRDSGKKLLIKHDNLINRIENNNLTGPGPINIRVNFFR